MAQQAAKVRACLAAAYPDAERAERLMATVAELPDLPDAAVLLDPLTDPPGTQP